MSFQKALGCGGRNLFFGFCGIFCLENAIVVQCSLRHSHLEARGARRSAIGCRGAGELDPPVVGGSKESRGCGLRFPRPGDRDVGPGRRASFTCRRRSRLHLETLPARQCTRPRGCLGPVSGWRGEETRIKLLR